MSVRHRAAPSAEQSPASASRAGRAPRPVPRPRRVPSPDGTRVPQTAGRTGGDDGRVTAAPPAPAPLAPARAATPRPGVAGPLLAGAGVLVLAAVVALDVRNAGTPVPPDVGLDPGWLTAAPGLALLLTGGVLQRRLPRHPIAWVLLVSGVLWVLDGLAVSWVVHGAYAEPGAPGVGAAAWFFFRFGSTLLLGVPVLLLLFPDGRLPRGRWRWVAVASLAITALLPLLLVVVPNDVASRLSGALPPPLDRLMPEPVVLPLPDPVWDVLLPFATALIPVTLLVPLAVVVWRYRGSDAVGRAQLRWLGWAGLVGVVALVVGALAPGPVANVLLGVSVTLPAVAVVVAVTRYRLYDVDRLLGATVVYGLLALSVVLLDLAVFAVAGTALGERDAALAAVAVVAVVYAPLRARLWSTVRRWLRGGREDRYGVVSALAERLEGSGTAEEQLLAVARTVAEAFRSPYVLVEVEQAGGGTLAVRHGEPDAAGAGQFVLPVAYRGQPVGRLVLARGAGLSRLSERDQRLLGDVVRQAAAAARATALSEQLQRSRGEIVAGREEERRRLRRDLHDGLGPSLAAVTLRIETARNLARTSAEAADRMLEQATEDVAAVLADVRRLVHDLRPPALDELGLAGAVEQLAVRFRGPGLPVEVSAADLGVLPAAVEVAAYRIVSEALANVVRHAEASSCCVRLARTASGLEVSVRDDGRGIPAGAPAGVGLASLRERAAELGGTCSVTCPPEGGTLVTAVLPLAT